MLAALIILLVMVGVGFVLNTSRRQFAWFLGLKRPAWLSFERLIPLIWIGIYACFYASALLGWTASSSWSLMLAYLVLLLLVQSYTWLICLTRQLRYGTAVALQAGCGGWGWPLRWLPTPGQPGSC